MPRPVSYLACHPRWFRPAAAGRFTVALVAALGLGCGSTPAPRRSPLVAQVAAGQDPALGAQAPMAAPVPGLHRALFIGDADWERSDLTTDYCMLLSGAGVARSLECYMVFGARTTLTEHRANLRRPDSEIGQRVRETTPQPWDVLVLQEQFDQAQLDAPGAEAALTALTELASASVAFGTRVVVLQPLPPWVDFELPAGPNDYKDAVARSVAWGNEVARRLPNATVIRSAEAFERLMLASMAEGGDPFSPGTLFARANSVEGVPTPVGAYLVAQLMATRLFPDHTNDLDWTDDRVVFTDRLGLLRIARELGGR